MTTASDLREHLVNFLERDLIGPAGGQDEVLEESPRIRYAAGVLFPQESLRNDSDTAGGVETDASAVSAGEEGSEDSLEPIEVEDHSEEVRAGSQTTTSPESEYDDTVTFANTYRPSAMGMSFIVTEDTADLVVDVRASIYRSRTERKPEREHPQTVWQREPLQIDLVSIQLAEFLAEAPYDRAVTEGLRVHGVIRSQPDGRHLVTISLYNATVEIRKEAKTFFQCGFDVHGADGTAPFVEYRARGEVTDDEEEAGLALLYRNRRAFAVGHGCATDWTLASSDRASLITTTALPSVIVPPVRPRSKHESFLDMDFLRGNCEHPSTDIPNVLDEFCASYEAWIETQRNEIGSLEPRFHSAARRHVSLCEITLERMRIGIALIASNPHCLEAFMLANRTMLMQQLHSRLRRRLGDEWVPLPQGPDDYASDWADGRGYWRAFQLAFILVALPGVEPTEVTVPYENESMSARDVVDLIWFPTGGGKTEAYLGLTAYMVFRRRLEHPNEHGCKALMRYTLRLLTSQQFQRAASLICACELIRRNDPSRYGASPITVGLWVGRSLTPNDERAALKALAELSRKPDDAKNPFQLLTCPWCGTEMNSRARYGYADRNGKMIFVCPSRQTGTEEACPFSERSNHLPVCVVDESIYNDPPTLIIGTVDKFAMLAWRETAGAILKTGGGPELIIQDELHLISGPLGSMVGLYEGAIDYLSSMNGSKPKIVASTATIRRAHQQCSALYDRRMFQFPPPGIDIADSYFAEEDQDDPGRMYLGFLPTAASSPLTAQIRSVVALQQGVLLSENGVVPDEAIDPYWTLVQYFGSLKELGRAATFITADIPEFLPTMHRRFGIEGDRRRYMRKSQELTSRKNEDEIPSILKDLEVPYKSGAKWHDQALDTVLATNMISVGVDIDRLGLMLIVTQPKGTSEYIQASSRVGRTSARPGLVFTLYNASRPRDRSHYEHFRGYHEAYYRYVEPTSVTPFSPPAMDRALHALLVIGARHVAEWSSPDDVDPDDGALNHFLDFIHARVRNIDPEHAKEFDDILRERLEQWEATRPPEWGSLRETMEQRALMRPAGKLTAERDASIWEIPTTMRNVDVECSVNVIARYVT